MTKKMVVLGGVIVLIVILIISKGIFKTNETVEKDTVRKDQMVDLKTKYNRFKEENKPSIVVISYNGDCCESTKKFFDKYNKKARNLIKDYEEQFNSLFINTGVLQKEDEKVLRSIMKENKASSLPSIILLDSKGDTFEVIEGSFEDKEIRNILKEMVQ